MTDMITVSRKEIEALIVPMYSTVHPEFVNDYVCPHSLRALLDKAEVSEPIGEMKENGVTWFKQNPHAYTVGTKFYTTPQPSRISELESEIAKLTAIIEDMKVVDNVFSK